MPATAKPAQRERTRLLNLIKEKFKTPQARRNLVSGKSKWFHASNAQLREILGEKPPTPSKQSANTKAINKAKGAIKRSGFAKTHVAERVAANLEGDKIKAKHRILRAINRELKSQELAKKGKLTPQEKRAIAIKAIKAEVALIKAGKAEAKGRRKNSGERSPSSSSGKNAQQHKEEVKPTKKPLPSPNEPIKLDQFIEFHKRLREGDMTADELKNTYERVKNSRELILAELSKMKKDELKKYVSNYIRSDNKKADLIKYAVDSIEASFAPGGISWQIGLPGAKEKAVDKEVASWTDEEIQKRASARKERIAKTAKAIENPETLEEFDTYTRYKKAESLSPEQLAKYEELQAIAGRTNRAIKQEVKATVQAANVPEGTAFKYAITKHTKTGKDLHVVSLSDRVDREVYNDLNSRAKKLGGYYSAFNKGGAIPGFQFPDKKSADDFMGLGVVDGKEKVAEKQEDRKSKSVERIRELADKLHEDAEERLNRDRLANTSRRARMAGHAENAARADIALAKTMSNVAEGIENNDVKFIDRLSNKAQFQQLESILSYARGDSFRARMKEDSRLRYDAIRDEPYGEHDIAHVEYPYPSIHKDILKGWALEGRDKPGLKLKSERMLKRWTVIANEDGNWQVKFKSESEINELRQFLDKLKSSRSKDTWDIESREGQIRDYDRLQKLDITTPVELKAALREYVKFRTGKDKADPIKEAERKLIGTNIDQFFPTPKKLVDRMIEDADIKPGMRVLEPSAGKGNIADEIKAKVGDKADLTVVEHHSTLVDILKLKGYEPRHEDFLEIKDEKFDRIVMNPPFAKGQDIDHVRHAYNLLAPGGKVVAIMSEGAFSRSDKHAEDFRSWLHSSAGDSEKLPEGSFKDSDRSTGVSTRLVVITKPGKNSQREN